MAGRTGASLTPGQPALGRALHFHRGWGGEDALCSPTASFKEHIVPSVVVRKIITPEGTKRQQRLVALQMPRAVLFLVFVYT